MDHLARALHRESRAGNLQEDGNDIRQIECHSCQREDRVRRDWASKVQKAREDCYQSGDPDRTDGGSRVIVHYCEEATIRETLITAKGVHGSGTSLKGSLHDKESGEADESPEEEGSGFSDSHCHDLTSK
jgi:hypothetical protein